MNCEECRDQMLEILYEEVDSKACFLFFKHLKSCSDCNDDYIELVQTRERLSDWVIDQSESLPPISWAPALNSPTQGRRMRIWKSFPFFENLHGWSLLPKVAAGILIVFGAFSFLQYFGYLGSRNLVVSEQQLAEMVQDMIVTNQNKERELIGGMLIQVREELDAQRGADIRDIRQVVDSLERRYLEDSEKNEHYLRTLVAQ